MRRVLVLMVAITVMFALAVPAGATPPSEVDYIEVENDLVIFGGPNPFVASGPAVTDGLICDAGVVFDVSAKATGISPTGFNFQGVKLFRCDDGSGEFFVNLQARIDFRKGTTFNWNVLSGIGAYQDLHGVGNGVGLPLCGDDCVLDVYEGGFHID